MLLKKRRQNRVLKVKKSSKIALFILLIIFSLLTYLLVLGIITRKWIGNEKMIGVFDQVDGGVAVAILDPLSMKFYDYYIPGITEIESAGNFGPRKVQNIAKVGENEGVAGGVYLAKTLTDQLTIPVYIYGDRNTYGIFSKNPNEFIGGIFLRSKTNLNLLDKIKLYYYWIRIKNADKIKINLSEAGFLEKATLSTGESGFVVSNRKPASIIDSFSNIYIQSLSSKFLLIDASGNSSKMQKAGEYVSIIGGKVVSIERTSPEDINCLVYAKTDEVLQYLTKLFGCSRLEYKDGTYDVVLKFGTEFLE